MGLQLTNTGKNGIHYALEEDQEHEKMKTLSSKCPFCSVGGSWRGGGSGRESERERGRGCSDSCTRNTHSQPSLACNAIYPSQERNHRDGNGPQICPRVHFLLKKSVDEVGHEYS